MAEIAAETGWTFDEIRTHALDELAFLKKAIDKRDKKRAEVGA